MIKQVVSQAAVSASAEIDNPIDELLPNFEVFGTEFTQLWEKLLGAAWAIALLVAIVFLIRGIATMAASKENPQAYSSGKSNVIWAVIAIAALAALPVIVGAILAVVS